MVKKFLKNEEEWDAFVDLYYRFYVIGWNGDVRLEITAVYFKPKRYPALVVYRTEQKEGCSFIEYEFVDKSDLM